MKPIHFGMINWSMIQDMAKQNAVQDSAGKKQGFRANVMDKADKIYVPIKINGDPTFKKQLMMMWMFFPYTAQTYERIGKTGQFRLKKTVEQPVGLEIDWKNESFDPVDVSLNGDILTLRNETETLTSGSSERQKTNARWRFI